MFANWSIKPLTNRVVPDPLLGAGVAGTPYKSCKQVGVIDLSQDAGGAAAADVRLLPPFALELALDLEARFD